MIKISLEKMLDITEGLWVGPKLELSCDRIEIDSRRVTEDAYFMPILGEVHNGHRFIKSAFDHGVKVSFCERAYYFSHQSALKGLSLILVDNTTTTLHRISKYILKETGVKTIGITGSVGKTSTKEFVYHVLKNKFHVHKNKGNFNNHIGMPLTIFDLEPSHDLAVLEMGMNHFKEIETLVEIARPKTAVITNIGTSHIGILGSRENIFQAKMEITSYLKHDETLIINIDDDFLHDVHEGPFKIIRVGDDLQCTNIRQLENGCYAYDIVADETHTVTLNVLGKHNIVNSMLAIAVGLEWDVTLKEACENISDYHDSSKRLEIIKGKRSSRIISDCYNASKESIISAIEVLNSFEGKSIAIIGDVLELGDFSKSSHEDIGEYISEHSVDVLFTFGTDSEYILNRATALGFKNHGRHFNDIESLYEALDDVIENSNVLVKGSLGMNMSRIVAFLGGNHESESH